MSLAEYREVTMSGFPYKKHISLAIWIHLTNPPSWLKLYPGKRTCGFYTSLLL